MTPALEIRRRRLGPLLRAARRPAVAVAAVVAAVLAMVLPGPSPQAAPPVPAAVPVVQTTSNVPVFRPEAVTITVLGVDAPVVPVGTDQDGKMGTPVGPVDVAWWQWALVGQDNALFAAHRDWKGEEGSFFSLDDLRPGDVITVSGEGHALDFEVASVRQVPATAPAADILGEVGEPAITLVTCGGTFDASTRHYTDRVIVRAVLGDGPVAA